MPFADIRTTAGIRTYLEWLVDAMKKKFSPELIVLYNYNVSRDDLAPFRKLICRSIEEMKILSALPVRQLAQSKSPIS
jgi:hypothetical protein